MKFVCTALGFAPNDIMSFEGLDAAIVALPRVLLTFMEDGERFI